MEENTPSQPIPSRSDEFFNRLVWLPDRMLLDDLVFRLQHYRDDSGWELGEQCFIYFKLPGLVSSYAAFFRTRPDFTAQNIFELGLWEGGSVPFWFELFQPARHVGLDIADRQDSPYFQQYVKERDLGQRLKTYWRTDQSDRARLLEIVQQEFEGKPLDLVIDDASHYYDLTRASFETLFPLLRPGGLYIIEDWAWEHWPGHVEPGWRKADRLGRLVHELTGIVGTSRDVVAEVVVYQGFAVAVRGERPASELTPFNLDDFIYRQPDPPVVQEPDPAFVQLQKDHYKLMEYSWKVAQDRQELVEYVRRVEQDRQLKLEEAAQASRRLQALESSAAVRLSRRLANLRARLTGKR